MTQALNLASMISAKAQAASPKPVEQPKTTRGDLNWETMDVATLPAEMIATFQTILQAQEAERKAKADLGDALLIGRKGRGDGEYQVS